MPTTRKKATRIWDPIPQGRSSIHRPLWPGPIYSSSSKPGLAQSSSTKPILSGEIQEGDSEALVEDFEKYALNYDYNDLVSIDDGAEEPGTYE